MRAQPERGQSTIDLSPFADPLSPFADPVPFCESIRFSRIFESRREQLFQLREDIEKVIFLGW
jgi:hypothetical protein